MPEEQPPPYEGTPQLQSEQDEPLSYPDELSIDALNDENNFLLF